MCVCSSSRSIQCCFLPDGGGPDMDYIGSLTCIRDHSYACVYTLGLGTPTAHEEMTCTKNLHAHIPER